MNILELRERKEKREKISMVTCYDYWSARLIDQSDIDMVLVGDSLAMVMHGYETTIPASVEVMGLHIQAVAKGVTKKFIVGDLPFLSFRKSHDSALEAVDQLMKAGAHAVKLEGAQGNTELIQHLVHSGVPVMGHLGLTPQSIHALGGFKVQGRDEAAAENLLEAACALEDAGCFSIVLECVPAALAQKITERVKVPTIGIGAGASVDGQVLVLQDLLGMNLGFRPKFLRTYMQGAEQITASLNQFHSEVRSGAFPTEEESYN